MLKDIILICNAKNLRTFVLNKNEMIMTRIKNQNMHHATINGKKTICGLSNQYKVADTVLEFTEKLKDQSWIKHCCKKCQTSINHNN